MADNVTLRSGSGGDTVAADDIGGVKFPRSKIIIGADGSNDGDVSATNPLPVYAPTAAAKWGTIGDAVVLIGGGASTPTLKALASGGNKLGGAYTNGDAAKRHQLAKVTLKVRGASAFTAGTFVKLWFLPLSADGLTYEDGDDSTAPARDADVEFALRAVATQQIIVEAMAILPPGSFKPLIQNNGGQAFTNTNDENVLTIQPYVEAEV